MLSAFEKSFFAGELDRIDLLADQAKAAVEQSLSCSPADSDLWAAGARLMLLTDGFSSRVADFLRMSCKTGPTQGWSASARLAVFAAVAEERLSADLRTCLQNDRLILSAWKGRRAG